MKVDQTIYNVLLENTTLIKVLSQSNISGKSLDLMIRNSRKSHDKIEIGYEDKKLKEIKQF